jgi:hypothetical protein
MRVWYVPSAAWWRGLGAGYRQWGILWCFITLGCLFSSLNEKRRLDAQVRLYKGYCHCDRLSDSRSRC